MISHGEGSRVYTEDGARLVDLATGFGAAFLGHSHPGVTRSLQEQAARLLASGRNPTAMAARVEKRIAALLPPGLWPAGIYSTGMEVAEFAMRVAAVHTGRAEFAGFARSMHGKSGMTAALSWRNAPLRPGNVHVLPFVDEAPEGEVLDALDGLLRGRRIAALFVEPIQGSNAAHEASAPFYRRAIDMCREHGTLCVMDETLTGLHRTGPRFYVEGLGNLPDMLLFAKCLGNGFPVSSAAVREDIRIGPEALPGSTFSGNPMALAAIEGTLDAMAAIPMRERVAAIDTRVRTGLARLPAGVTLRGHGALWCLDLGDRERMQRVHAAMRAEGLLVTCGDRFIRLLPAVTIEASLLDECCEAIRRACAAAAAA